MILYPVFSLKLLKIKWGNAIDMLSLSLLTSCLIITFYKDINKVGPIGKWLIISPLGIPLVSWINNTSEKF